MPSQPKHGILHTGDGINRYFSVNPVVELNVIMLLSFIVLVYYCLNK